MRTALFHAAVVLAVADAVGREELLDREADAAEERAGIILGDRAGALLIGQAVVIGGNEQLSECADNNNDHLMMLNWPIVANQRRAVSVRTRLSSKAAVIAAGMLRCSSSVGSRHSESQILQCRQIGSTELTTAMGSSSTVESGSALSEE